MPLVVDARWLQFCFLPVTFSHIHCVVQNFLEIVNMVALCSTMIWWLFLDHVVDVITVWS